MQFESPMKKQELYRASNVATKGQNLDRVIQNRRLTSAKHKFQTFVLHNPAHRHILFFFPTDNLIFTSKGIDYRLQRSTEADIAPQGS